ncbi:DMT family transporter [Hydrogenophaga taeniospiralis]|jgi:drug/metabolite transporter (DMT)-like permease|uniref:DMT family transporter n=1 Tax=Hydrogenophaga taeniospiralis TaxID=65656 RepID=UPI001CFAE630|nr:DMT family transporter [Hydrogenophaga taeniospiralis]MCB4364526.1 DMT family transporter [Hydrogenophaga taeniospiralis]
MSPALILEFFLLAALWGSSFLFMRLGAAEFGALPTAGLRVALAALFLLPVFLLKGVWADFRLRAKPILFVGLLNSGIPFALFSFAVMHITTGLTSILNATVPLLGAVVAWLWLKDRPGGSRMLGLGIGFVGVTLLVLGKSGFSATGVAGAGSTGTTLLAMGACLLATLCYGIAASFTKRYLTGAHPLATATGSQIGAALGLALPTLWLWPEQPVSATAWGALAAVALFCTAIAYILFFHIIEKAGPSKALTVTFLVPVFALLYGGFFLGERITPWMVICGLIIVCGTALSTGLVRLQWLERRASA